MQFRALEPGIQVHGLAIHAFVDGSAQHRQVVTRVLADEGVGRLASSGAYHIHRDGWYPQEAWLRGFARIAASGACDSLFEVGRRIGRGLELLDWVVDIDSAIRSIDVAHHLDHRKDDAPMFCAEKGTMREGIGHYGYLSGTREREVFCLSNTPHPCDFDRGILSAMAQRFEPQAKVVHDEPQRCRKLGADSCMYIVTW